LPEQSTPCQVQGVKLCSQLVVFCQFGPPVALYRDTRASHSVCGMVSTFEQAKVVAAACSTAACAWINGMTTGPNELVRLRVSVIGLPVEIRMSYCCGVSKISRPHQGGCPMLPRLPGKYRCRRQRDPPMVIVTTAPRATDQYSNYC
jgi:hypothetical protein